VTDQSPVPPPNVVVENIEKMVKMEEDAINVRSRATKFVESVAGFIGTIRFIVLQATFMITWIVLNIDLFRLPAFDPSPYPLLGLICTIECVVLTAIVVMKQNRMALIADRREHLDLQVNLLTEREVTQMIRMQRMICEALEIRLDKTSREFAKQTDIDQIVQDLSKRLPSDQP
jgi:uncharacterized membrane protein